MQNLYLSKDGEGYYVLVSRGWGAGWSSWNFGIELAYRKEIVEYWLAHRVIETEKDEEDCIKFLNSLYPQRGDDYFCLLGWNDIELVRVNFGEYWRIDEYDGAERIEILNINDFTCFSKED